jgi:hypothetical protein
MSDEYGMHPNTRRGSRSRAARVVVSILFGILITGAVLLVSADSLLGPRFAQILLFPATLFLRAAGPGPNIGGPEHPMHELTVVHLAAMAAGLQFSAVMYAGLMYLVLKKIGSYRSGGVH